MQQCKMISQLVDKTLYCTLTGLRLRQILSRLQQAAAQNAVPVSCRFLYPVVDPNRKPGARDQTVNQSHVRKLVEIADFSPKRVAVLRKDTLSPEHGSPHQVFAFKPKQIGNILGYREHFSGGRAFIDHAGESAEKFFQCSASRAA